MDMKYWFIGIGILILFGLITYSLSFSSAKSSSEYMSTLPMSEADERKDCVMVLNQYAPKHPMNLKCSLVENQSPSGGDKIYLFTTPDGTALTIDTYSHTVILRDKNGNILESQ